MKKIITVAIIFLTACKESHEPPPIKLGHCLVDRFVGDQAMKQVCSYVGYSWVCTLDEGVNTCNRAAEAAIERAPEVAPTAIPTTMTPTDAGVD